MEGQLQTCKFLANYKTLERSRSDQPLHSLNPKLLSFTELRGGSIKSNQIPVVRQQQQQILLKIGK